MALKQCPSLQLDTPGWKCLRRSSSRWKCRTSNSRSGRSLGFCHDRKWFFQFCHRQPLLLCFTLVLLSYICKGCVLFTAASTVHPFVPLLPGEKRLSRTMPLPVFGSVKAGLAFLFAVVHSLSIGAWMTLQRETCWSSLVCCYGSLLPKHWVVCILTLLWQLLLTFHCMTFQAISKSRRIVIIRGFEGVVALPPDLCSLVLIKLEPTNLSLSLSLSSLWLCLVNNQSRSHRLRQTGCFKPVKTTVAHRGINAQLSWAVEKEDK